MSLPRAQSRGWVQARWALFRACSHRYHLLTLTHIARDGPGPAWTSHREIGTSEPGEPTCPQQSSGRAPSRTAPHVAGEGLSASCPQPGALRGGAFPGFTGRAELDSLSRALPQLPLPNLDWWSCCPQDPGRPQGYGSPPDQLGEQGQGPQPIGEGRRDPPGDLGRGHGCLSVPGGLLCPHPHAGPRQLGAAVQQRCPLPAHSPACPRAAPLGPSSWVQQPRPPALSSG